MDSPAESTPQLLTYERININPTELKEVTRLVAGPKADPEMQDWVQSNIVTTREAIQIGQHSTMLYPASGYDIIRPLYAYDVDHLIVIENDPNKSGLTERQLKELEISAEVKEDVDRCEIVFEMEGKKRKVTEVQGDARLFTPDSFGYKQIDILYISLPTGADHPVQEDEVYLRKKYGDEWLMKRHDPEAMAELERDPLAPKRDPKTGEYKTLAEAIEDKLTFRNYSMVSEGGFIILNEDNLEANYGAPKSLLKIAGLEERKITQRHPDTLHTSIAPKPEDVKDRTGYVYQKTRTASEEVINLVDEALSQSFWTHYPLIEFERGNFEYLGIEEDKPIPVSEGVKGAYTRMLTAVDQIIDKFRSADIDPDLLAEYRTESINSFKERISLVQKGFRDLDHVARDLVRKLKKGELTQEQVLNELGIIIETNQAGDVLDITNIKWPMASKLVLSGPKQQWCRQVIDEFMDFSFK